MQLKAITALNENKNSEVWQLIALIYAENLLIAKLAKIVHKIFRIHCQNKTITGISAY
jgi:hypothetical protein